MSNVAQICSIMSRMLDMISDLKCRVDELEKQTWTPEEINRMHQVPRNGPEKP